MTLDLRHPSYRVRKSAGSRNDPRSSTPFSCPISDHRPNNPILFPLWSKEKPRKTSFIVRSNTISYDSSQFSTSLHLSPPPLLSKISPRLSFVDAQPVAIREFIRRGSPCLEVLSSLHARSRENRSRGRRIRSGPICIRIDATRQFG